MVNRSLVGKLWMAMVILVILVMFVLGFFLSGFFEDFYFSLKARELEEDGVKIAQLISSNPDRQQWENELFVLSKYTDASIIITDREGLIRSSTMQGRGMHKGQKFQYPDVERILRGEIVAQRGIYPGFEVTVLSVGVPVKFQGDVIGAVILHSPVEPVTKTVRTVQLFIIYGTVGTIILATILGFILSKKLTQPILDMNRVALEMAKGNFDEKVVTDAEDELGLLARTLNYLSSELQQNLDALSTEKEQLKNILTSMTDAVITFDVKGNILLINPPAVLLLGLDPDSESRGAGDNSCPAVLEESFNTVMSTKNSLSGEVTINDRTFRLGMTPLRHDTGDIRGVVAVLHDFTKEKRLESLRREFVANVSHELRSPLSLLQGYVEALSDGLAQNEDERKKYLDIVLDETLRLRRLVNDLLDLTQLETGNMNMKFEQVSAYELVNRVTERFLPLFREQGKTLDTNIPEDLPLAAGDEDRLQQVLVNLLDNAIKYTPQNGCVEVGAAVRDNMVEIFVQDSGPGMSKEELTLIWNRFYKIDKARTRDSQSGTGLGLAIAKNIVQAHGGEVKAQSEPGRGTRISFSIPISDC